MPFIISNVTLQEVSCKLSSDLSLFVSFACSILFILIKLITAASRQAHVYSLLLVFLIFGPNSHHHRRKLTAHLCDSRMKCSPCSLFSHTDNIIAFKCKAGMLYLANLSATCCSDARKVWLASHRDTNTNRHKLQSGGPTFNN